MTASLPPCSIRRGNAQSVGAGAAKPSLVVCDVLCTSAAGAMRCGGVIGELGVWNALEGLIWCRRRVRARIVRSDSFLSKLVCRLGDCPVTFWKLRIYHVPHSKRQQQATAAGDTSRSKLFVLNPDPGHAAGTQTFPPVEAPGSHASFHAGRGPAKERPQSTTHSGLYRLANRIRNGGSWPQVCTAGRVIPYYISIYVTSHSIFLFYCSFANYYVRNNTA